jgi:hypothetical protein
MLSCRHQGEHHRNMLASADMRVPVAHALGAWYEVLIQALMNLGTQAVVE